MDQDTIMIIVWAAVVGLALLIEFISYDLVSLWVAPAALVGLTLAALSVPFWWQIIVVVVLTVVFILAFRPLMKRWLIKPTIPTDITTTNIGKHLRLTSDMRDGYSTIEINGVTWTAKQEIEGAEDLKEGAMVEITGHESNRFYVREYNVAAK